MENPTTWDEIDKKIARVFHEHNLFISNNEIGLSLYRRIGDFTREQICVARSEVERLTQERDTYIRLFKNEYWMWQGDGEDHLESLTCPVVISVTKMRALQQQVSALREALFNARKKATEIVDEYVMARGQSDPDVNVGHARLWGASRVRNEVSTIIDAALAQSPESGIKGVECAVCGQWKGAWDRMRERILYLHGPVEVNDVLGIIDDEYVPSPEPAPEVKP